MEESTRPDYVIPVGSADGVWAMMKTLGRFRGEGWLALWKGLCPEHLVNTSVTLRL
jgi:fusion and transport protein UGO1